MYNNLDSDMELRLATNDKLAAWTKNDNELMGYDLLKELLGKPEHEAGQLLRRTFNNEDRQTCLALCGPYGYAIFKMLCAKRNVNISTKAGRTP